MTIKRAFIYFSLTASVLCSFHRPADAQEAWKAEWDKTVAAARQEGKFVLYIRAYDGVVKAFSKRYPDIKPTVVRGEGDVIGSRILTERRAGQYITDLYIGGPHTVLGRLIPAGAVDSIKDVLVLPEVVDQSKWLNGRHSYSDPGREYNFTFIANPGTNQLAYNTNLVDPTQITSYKDFLKPEWKGKIVSLDPTDRHVGGSLQFFYYNPDLGPDFFRQFFGGPNVVFARNTRQMTDWLATGKFAICLGCLASKRATTQGLPIALFNTSSGFREGASVGPGSGTVSILNRAPHPNAAKVFVNWLLSREGQIELQKVDEGGVHVNSARIDIPKDDVDPDNRLIEGAHYYDQNTPEWSKLDPIFALAKEVVAAKAAK